MAKRAIDTAAIKRAAIRATKESASLEKRTVPTTYVRSEQAERYLAERRNRA